MIIPIENKCVHCSKVFCCVQCRIKHEKKSHVVDGKFRNCSLCRIHQPPLNRRIKFILQKQHSDELIAHLCAEHLPMRCNKCGKTFNEFTDFKNLCGCTNSLKLCELEIEKEMSENVEPLVSPMIDWNKQWQSKIPNISRNISDSVSSIRNVSSIDSSRNDMHKTASPTKTLVRQTSTPMQALLGNGIGKPTINSFDTISSSGGSQYSTINSTQTSDITDNSSPPVFRNSTHSLGKITKSPKQRRNKIPATPLRQVMSKSIQKALVQHGMHNVLQFKSKFSPAKTMTPPLDLRTRATIHRLHNKSTAVPFSDETIHTLSNNMDDGKPSGQNEISNEASIGNNCLDTVYETCIDKNLVTDPTVSSSVILQTPKNTGVKKTVSSFADNIGNVVFDEDNLNDKNADETANIQWFTPNGAPMRNYGVRTVKRAKNTIFESGQSDAPKNQMMETTSSSTSKTGAQKLWSMLTSVMKMASFKREQSFTTSDRSIIKRCSSFAGRNQDTLTDHNSDSDYLPAHKRRRINTASALLEGHRVKRPKRIHGRPPIDRFLQNS